MPTLEWWPEKDASRHELKSAHWAWQLACCLLTPLLIYGLLVDLWLLKRFLMVKFGRREAPSGSKAVVITGATSGFGLATAKRLFSRGFTVFACYFNNQESGYQQLLDLKLESIKLQGITTGGQQREPRRNEQHLFLVQMDVRSAESIEAAAREMERLIQMHQLRLHCLLNNAGISADGPFEFIDGQSIRNIVDTNLAGVFQVTRAFALRLVKDQGRVVNVSSGVHLFPARSISLYGSCKAAVSYFSAALHQDLLPYGAACYTVVPGNFLLHSNILFTRISSAQRSLAQLSAEERRVYRAKIEQHTAELYSLLKARLAHTKEDPAKLAALYRVELPNFSSNGAEPEAPKSLLQRLMVRIVRLSDGSSRGDVELEETGVIDCFESAVVLARPPRHTYAGNRLYQFVTGPMAEFLPRFALDLMGNPMVTNLLLSK